MTSQKKQPLDYHDPRAYRKKTNKKEAFAMEQSNISLLVEQYISSGIGALIPLREESKTARLKGLHGEIPEQSEEEARKNFDSLKGKKLNVAVRLTDTVIGIDVDHNLDKGKHGADTLAVLEAELGKLPATAYNTRYGAKADNRHMFFRVPAGIKWESKIPGHIDILQRTHRYAVVAPSEYDGKAYQWFDAEDNELSTPPHIDDLPALPGAWIDRLRKGNLAEHLKYSPAQSFAAGEATQWLESVAPDYDAEIPTSSRENLNTFTKDIADSAHDNVLKAIRWAVRHAVTGGAPGLKKILAEIEKAFTAARSSRPTDESPALEYSRALVGEVNALRGAIEAGKERPIVAATNADMSNAITELLGAKKAGIRHSALVDKVRAVISYYDAESAAGEVLALALPSALAVVSQNAETETDIFDEKAQDYLGVEAIKSVARKNARPIIDAAYYVEPENATDEEAIKIALANKEIANVFHLMTTARYGKAVKMNFAVALKEQNRVVRRDSIDAQENLLGLADGRVVDLNLATSGCSIADVIRERNKGELVTKKLGIDPEKAAAALAHRRKHYRGEDRKAPAEAFLELAFPNPAVRKVAQKLLGYAAYGRTESRFRNLPVFMGPSSSGKTVLTNLIQAVAGDYSGQVGIEALSKPDDGPNAELAAVIHSRWLFVPELSSANTAASARLKAIASSEGVKATKKHSNEPIHSMTITPIIVTNDAPSMRIDDAILKRLVVIPMATSPEILNEKLPKPAKGEYFRRNVFGEEVDQDFYLDDENKAFIFDWLIQGFLLMRSEGIDQSTMPKEIQDAITDFVGEADPISAWLDTLDFSDATAQSSRIDLENDFNRSNAGLRFPTGASLKKLLERRGACYKRSNGSTVYMGVQPRLGEADNEGTEHEAVPISSIPRAS